MNILRELTRVTSFDNMLSDRLACNHKQLVPRLTRATSGYTVLGTVRAALSLFSL